MPKPINATCRRDTKCTRCRAKLSEGSRVAMFRERALSLTDARNHNTMYPFRIWCPDCAKL